MKKIKKKVQQLRGEAGGKVELLSASADERYGQTGHIGYLNLFCAARHCKKYSIKEKTNRYGKK